MIKIVNAKLHIICGNCGSTNFIYSKYENYLGCRDCATIHTFEHLEDNKMENSKDWVNADSLLEEAKKEGDWFYHKVKSIINNLVEDEQ